MQNLALQPFTGKMAHDFYRHLPGNSGHQPFNSFVFVFIFTLLMKLL